MRLLMLMGLLLLLVPATAAALDCTPFQSWTCSSQGYYDYFAGQPGEVLCGMDFTGWTLHVVEVTIATPGFYAFSGLSAYDPGAFPANIVDTTIMLMDDCVAGTCIDSATSSSGTANLLVCLDAGTHLFVVASNTTDPDGFMNIGLNCTLTCEDAEAIEFPCVHCGTVGNETKAWGAVKERFR